VLELKRNAKHIKYKKSFSVEEKIKKTQNYIAELRRNKLTLKTGLRKKRKDQ
jgi:hypothetical protein